MSQFICGKAVGMFYGDRCNRNCRLDAESYKRFKQLVTMAGLCLGKNG